MRVCLVNLWHEPTTDPDEHIALDRTRRGFAEALAARGHDVHVAQEFPTAGVRHREGVTWHFTPATRLTRSGRALLAAVRHPHPRVPTPANSTLATVANVRPDIIHTFDLVFYPSLLLLGRLARRLGAALLAHDHGGEPASRPGWRQIERAALSGCDRVLFTTMERARQFPTSDVALLTETSTFFQPVDAAEARTRTGLRGNPILLCPGRLDPVKDPLTTIAGFALLRKTHPDARLYLCWTAAPMLDAVTAAVQGLGEAITLLGRVPHAQMQDFLASADLVVQSSVREVCGIAVLEALACGIPPVVTDIPAFRHLTGGGVGALFEVGDPAALADAAARALGQTGVRKHFEQNLSFPVLAGRLEAIYAEALRARAR